MGGKIKIIIVFLFLTLSFLLAILFLQYSGQNDFFLGFETGKLLNNEIIFNDFDFYYNKKPLVGAKRLSLTNLVIDKIRYKNKKELLEVELLYLYQDTKHRAKIIIEGEVGYSLGEREESGLIKASEFDDKFNKGDVVNLNLLYFDYNKIGESPLDEINTFIENISESNNQTRNKLKYMLKNPANYNIDIRDYLKNDFVDFSKAYFVLTVNKIRRS